MVIGRDFSDESTTGTPPSDHDQRHRRVFRVGPFRPGTERSGRSAAQAGEQPARAFPNSPGKARRPPGAQTTCPLRLKVASAGSLNCASQGSSDRPGFDLVTVTLRILRRCSVVADLGDCSQV
jgi:hypothetical protein